MLDKEHYQELIEQLSPVVNEPEFDAIFAQLMQGESGPDRLQLKLELKRLAAPSNRTIDLRDHVSHDCQPVPYNNRIFYLDERARDIFEQGLRRYNGIFTEDTFQKLKSYSTTPLTADEAAAELAIQNSNDERMQTPAFEFASYSVRAEERMNFVIEVSLMLNSAATPDVEVVAMTTDISIQGLRLKVSEKLPREIRSGQPVYIRFTGLAQQFTIDPNERIPYQIVAIETDKNKKNAPAFIRLKRMATFSSDRFDTFLLGFINGYKRRYKLNLENTLAALLGKGHEQFYLPRLTALPIYFKRVENRMFADMVLQTDNNHSVIDDWRDELNQTLLGGLFTGRRLSQLLQQAATVKHCVIYTFSVTVKGKIYFYSATAEELQATDLFDAFVAFGRNKVSWRVYNFTLTKADKAKIWQPLSVPATIEQNSEQQAQFRPPTPRVMQRLEHISHIGALLDITAIATPLLQQTEFKRSDIQRLKKFTHAQRLPYKTQVVSLEFVNLRQESRFSYRTPVKFMLQNRTYFGVTLDFSVQGLQIDIDDAYPYALGSEIKLDLPELNRHRRKKNLVGLAYEVVGISDDKTTLNLQINQQDTQHPGAQFFAELIESNREQLSVSREQSQLHGIELCLRNLYCAALMSLPMFLHKQPGKPLALEQVGYSKSIGRLTQLINSEESPANMDAGVLFQPEAWQDIILPRLNELSRTSTPDRLLLALRQDTTDGQPDYSRCWLTNIEVADAEEARQFHEFLKDTQTADSLLILQLSLSRTGRPDTDFIARELKYVSAYASHKAKELEKLLWQVTGIIDIHDVTTAVMHRFRLSEGLEMVQQQA